MVKKVKYQLLIGLLLILTVMIGYIGSMMYELTIVMKEINEKILYVDPIEKYFDKKISPPKEK